MKKYLSDYLQLFVMAGIIVAFDQWTKYLVRTTLPVQETWSPWPWLAPYARIVHWTNTGAAFGMFQQLGDIFMWLAIVVTLAILYYYPRVQAGEWYLRLALGIQMGGAVGNLIDRLTKGTVTDFISVGNFAVFNVADASISVSVVVLLLGFWIKDRQQRKRVSSQILSTPPTEPDAGSEKPPVE